MVKTKSNFNADRLKERIENAGQSRGNWYLKKNDKIKSFKALEGDNFIRVLPAYDEEHDFALDIHVHYNIGTGADKSAFLCLSRMKNEACPICEESNKLAQAGREQESKNLRPAGRTLFFVLDRDKPEDGIKLYDAPTYSVGSPIINLCLNRRTRVMTDISDIHKGFDVILVRQGLGPRNTKYTSIGLDHPSTPLGNDVSIKDLIPFDDVLNYADYETIKAEFYGTAKPEVEEDHTACTEDELPDIDTGESDVDVPEDYCPEGFEFGEDYDEEEECEDCEKTIRRACRKAHKALNDAITA